MITVVLRWGSSFASTYCHFLLFGPVCIPVIVGYCPHRPDPETKAWMPDKAGRPISNRDRNHGRVEAVLVTLPESATHSHFPTSTITMLPLFGADDRKRRNINLGGRSTSSTHTSILDEARLRREERLNQLKRQQSAIRIQAWWRGKREASAVRAQLRHRLDQDPTGINGLRSVVLIGQDEESLAIWSSNALQSGEGRFGSP